MLRSCAHVEDDSTILNITDFWWKLSCLCAMQTQVVTALRALTTYCLGGGFPCDFRKIFCYAAKGGNLSSLPRDLINLTEDKVLNLVIV